MRLPAVEKLPQGALGEIAPDLGLMQRVGIHRVSARAVNGAPEIEDGQVRERRIDLQSLELLVVWLANDDVEKRGERKSDCQGDVPSHAINLVAC